MNLRIALFQTNLIWENPSDNINGILHGLTAADEIRKGLQKRSKRIYTVLLD